MKILKVLLAVVVLFAVGAGFGIYSLSENIRTPADPMEVSAFEEIPSGVRHEWNKATHPFTGAAVIDADGDGAPEIFAGGGEGQDDRLLRFSGGRLEADASASGVSARSATHGAVAIDLDRDGDADLAVARNDGVYLHINEGGAFTARKLEIDFGRDEVPLSVAAGDVNGDGHVDLYVSVFVSFPAFRSATFNDPGHAKHNRLLLNRGDLTFDDITGSSGVGGKQNTFTSAFVDLDGDAKQDLVLAQNTGRVEIFRNLGQGKFEAVPVDTGHGFWMGLAVGDYDADGDQDLYFSNLGVSIPAFFTTGDLAESQRHEIEWLLLRNDGNFRFTDATEELGLTGYGFSWGAVFEDLNLDGRLDLAVAQNYIKWPLHKVKPLGSKTFLLHAGGEEAGFYHYDELRLDNRHFAQTPLIADLDSDGRPDFLWLNMAGPLRAFRNTSKANFISVAVPDTLPYLGANVSVETASGKLYTRHVTGSIGLMSDQTPTQFFGLGDGTQVERVTIEMANGLRLAIDNPDINRTLKVREFSVPE